MTSEYGTLTKTTALFAGANIAGKLLKLVIIPLYTYYMTSAQLGTAETITITAGLICLVIASGANEAAIRFSMDENYTVEAVASNCFAVFAAGALPGIILCLLLSQIDAFKGHALLLILLTVMGAVDGLMSSLAKGIGENKVYAASEIVSSLALLISCVVALVLLDAGLEGYLWSRIIAYAARIIYIDLRTKLHRKLRMGVISKDVMIPIVKFALPLMPSALLWWIMDLSDRYIILWMLGPSSVGIYAIACKLPSALTSLNVVFHQAWQLSAIRQYFKGDFREFYNTVLKAYSTFFFGAAAAIIAIARPLIQILDDSYEDAWRYIPLLLIASVFMGLSGFTGVNYTVTGKTTGALTTSLVGAAVNLSLTLILVRRLGIQGAAIASFAAYYVFWLIRTLHIKRELGTESGIAWIHLNLFVVLTESFCILSQQSWYFVALCLAAFIVLNLNSIKAIISLIAGLLGNGKIK